MIDILSYIKLYLGLKGRRIVSFWGWIFTTTCAIIAYHHWSCEFESRSCRCVIDAISCDKVCQWLWVGQWFSPGTPVSSTNKTDRHDITEILLKVALNTITPVFGICCSGNLLLFFIFQFFRRNENLLFPPLIS